MGYGNPDTWEEIPYDDEEALRDLLVGASIVDQERTTSGSTFDPAEQVIYTLDNGYKLVVEEGLGGCSCGNGDFPIETPNRFPAGTIMNVKVIEDAELDSSYGGDESATIQMFVMTEFEDVMLVDSEGHDNGYYGWGYHVYIVRPDKEVV